MYKCSIYYKISYQDIFFINTSGPEWGWSIAKKTGVIRQFQDACSLIANYFVFPYLLRTGKHIQFFYFFCCCRIQCTCGVNYGSLSLNYVTLVFLFCILGILLLKKRCWNFAKGINDYLLANFFYISLLDYYMHVSYIAVDSFFLKRVLNSAIYLFFIKSRTPKFFH